MTDGIPDVFIDVQLSKAKLTLFSDGNCFLIASPVSKYSLPQMLLRVLVDGSPSSLGNELYDRHTSKFVGAVHGL